MGATTRPQDPSGGPLRIAYLFTDLPDHPGTFAYAELDEMARRGFGIEIYCLRGRLASGPGALALRTRFPVHSCHYLSPAALLSLLRLCFRRPGRFFRGLFSAIGETASSPKILIKTLAILPKCSLFSLHMAKDRPDLLHAYWASLPGRAAWWISSFTDIPYSTWAHAGADIYNRNHQTEPALRTTLRGAALVLTCNRANLEYFRTILPPEAMSRVVCHAHGIDLSLFSEAKRDEPEIGLADDPGASGSGDAAAPPTGFSRAFAGAVRLLSVGTVSEAKGFDHAVRACRLLLDRGQPCRYRIIGGGAGRGALQSLVDSLGLQDHVELAGPQEQRTLPAEYAAADIFLVPSVIGKRGARDGLPNVLLEAMACGLPAVGSDAVGIPEAITHGQTGILVPPADPYALAGAILDLAADPDLRRRLGHAGRRFVEESFTREVCMDRLAGIFRDLHRTEPRAKPLPASK